MIGFVSGNLMLVLGLTMATWAKWGPFAAGVLLAVLGLTYMTTVVLLAYWKAQRAASGTSTDDTARLAGMIAGLWAVAAHQRASTAMEVPKRTDEKGH